jgi:hypothetical protein
VRFYTLYFNRYDFRYTDGNKYSTNPTYYHLPRQCTFDCLYPHKRVIKLLVVIIKVDHLSAPHNVVSSVFLQRLTPYEDGIIGDADFKKPHD